MNERIKIKLPIIVEGRYDKSTLSAIFDAKIITTEGFGIFNSREKKALIKKLAECHGVILLTDSDSGGKQIRSFLSGFLPKDKLFHLYIPKLEGKEARKKTPSKSGLIGVEGMSRDVLEKVLAPFIERGACEKNGKMASEKAVTKLDFFSHGLSGSSNSSEKRRRLALYFDLPGDMSANALIEAINLVVGYEGYKRAYNELFEGDGMDF